MNSDQIINKLTLDSTVCPHIHCPFCGKLTYFDPCPHVLLYYSTYAEEATGMPLCGPVVEEIAPAVATAFKKLQESDASGGDKDLLGLILEELDFDPEDLLLIEVEHGGHTPMGPSSSWTDYVLIKVPDDDYMPERIKETYKELFEHLDKCWDTYVYRHIPSIDHICPSQTKVEEGE